MFDPVAVDAGRDWGFSVDRAGADEELSMARDKHEFQFKASDISDAAGAEAKYHEDRIKFWQDEMDASYKTVEKTAKVTIRRVSHSCGWSPQVDVDYGDAAAYRRMQQAADKIQSHQKAADAFRSDEKLYGTQGERIYELGTSDVHYFRLGGGAREE